MAVRSASEYDQKLDEREEMIGGQENRQEGERRGREMLPAISGDVFYFDI